MFKCLSAYRLVYGEKADRVDICAVLEGLGRSAVELGDLDRAGQLLEKCAEISARMYGSAADHGNIADVL